MIVLIYVVMNLIFNVFFKKVNALGCFKCISYNGTDDGCSDPYHSIHGAYSFKCFAGRPDRKGIFPAHFCYKIKGTQVYSNDRYELYVRDCSVEDMGNMCGQFEYLGRRMNGCILTCTADGCNTGARILHKNTRFICQFVTFICIHILWKLILC